MVANVKVIKKIEGRVDRRNGGVLNRLLRVTAYARVSTDDEDQRNSYQSQLMFFKSKIRENSEWVYVDMYADEAITGTLDYKRSDFMRMINDALAGKFDMIIRGHRPGHEPVQLTILSSVAQQESENISNHVKLGFKAKMERGELIGFNGCLGYDYDPITKTLSVNDKEKKIVQYIYDRYIQGYRSNTNSKGINRK